MPTTLHFEWKAPTTRSNGTPLTTVFYRLFENGKKVVDNIGAPNFDLVIPDDTPAESEYQVAAVEMRSGKAIQSALSASVVNFIKPNPPTGLTVLEIG
jgi:hypothetical protein